jgi:hypothetical protein
MTKAKKTPTKKSEVPKWLKCVPEGGHGSGSLQKRLWKLVSDYTRIRDWYKWGDICPSSGKRIPSWQSGHAGHFKSYSRCNGLYKFNPNNIHLQHGYGNKYPDKDDWKALEGELVRRYGQEFVDKIETDNRDHPLPIHKPDIIEKIHELIPLIKALPEQPDYFHRLEKNLLDNHE